jgi:hypothetical protein
MAREVRVEVLDPGATTAAAQDDGESRQRFLGRVIVAGGALTAGGVLVAGLPRLAESAPPSREQDVHILNFAATLEYLQAAFFTEAEVRGGLSGPTLEFARVGGAHEHAHVGLFEQALGRRIRGKPRFDFGDSTADVERFQAAAMLLEDLAVGAYDGQGPNLTREALTVAARIVSVEARHAAWIRTIIGRPPAPRPFDPPQSRQEVLQAVDQTGFLVG